MTLEARYLLDVKVLVALMDEAHVHHAVAHKLLAQPKLKIATCALTENGVIRQGAELARLQRLGPGRI